MMKKFVLSLLALAIVVAGPALPARAGIGDLIGNVIGNPFDALEDVGQTIVQDFLDGMNQSATDLLNQGRNEANLLLIQASNEMSVLTSTAATLFGNELNRSIGSASAELRVVLAYLERLRRTVQESTRTLIELEDLIYLDVASLLDSLPGLRSSLSVRRIDGLSVVQDGSSTYSITLSGLGFADGATLVSMSLNGTAISQKTPIPPYGMKFTVAADSLAPLFSEDEFVTLPLVIQLSRPAGLFNLGTENAKLEVQVVLLPRQAGTLTFTVTRPVFHWRSVADPIVDRRTVRTDYPFTQIVSSPAVTGIPLPGAMRITDVIATCDEMMRTYRRFPNGEQWRASSSIFRDGWTSAAPFSFGGMDRRALYEMRETFGLDLSLGEYQAGHIYVPARILLRESREVEVDITGCDEMRAENAVYGAARGSATLLVRGEASADASWTVTFETETFVQTDTETSLSESVPVFVSNPIEIRINDFDQTSTQVEFTPIAGAVQRFILGEDFKGFTFIDANSVGADRLFYYRFSY